MLVELAIHLFLCKLARNSVYAHGFTQEEFLGNGLVVFVCMGSRQEFVFAVVDGLGEVPNVIPVFLFELPHALPPPSQTILQSIYASYMHAAHDKGPITDLQSPQPCLWRFATLLHDAVHRRDGPAKSTAVAIRY